MERKTSWIGIAFVLALAISAAGIRCDSGSSEGRQLAETYCGSCHLFPEPSLLPREVWQVNVLPAMLPYLGLSSPSNLSAEEARRINQAGVYPSQPLLDKETFGKIQQFYLDHAPEFLPSAGMAEFQSLEKKFRQVRVKLPPGASITMLRFDSSENRLLAGFQNGMLLALNDSFGIADTFRFASTISDARILAGKLAVLEMGKLLPSDIFRGKLIAASLARQTPNRRSILLQELNRPVELQFANVVGDSLPEAIICEYGNRLGSLFWCETDATGDMGERHILSKIPGVRTAIPCDADNDGRTDLLALFAQGNERVALFKNKGNGIFEEKILLRFPPVNGSSFLELADMDADGDPDLVLSNGDNGDYSIILKPWHGVRIFGNDGNWNFSEKWFHPMNGAGKTITRDFDGDGDFDIAAISYFPDFGSNPKEGFVFFENKGNLKFEPFSLPEAKLGRWLVMDAGDFDGDGDDDLALGSCITGPRMGIPPELTWEWAEEGVSLLVLMNEMR